MHPVLQSLTLNGRGILLMIASSLMVAVGQLLWKINGPAMLAVGCACYGIGAVLMMVAFRYGRFSVIHPMLAFSYVFSTVLGAVFLGERCSPGQLAGIGLIMAGVALIGGGDRE